MKRHQRRWISKIVGVVIFAVAAWLAYEVWTWPNISALARRAPAKTAFMTRYAEQQRAAGRDARVAHTWVPYGAISPHLKRAVLVAEDVNFFSHRGFELEEVKKALVTAVEEQHAPRGASTITQQLAKNLFLTPDQTLQRKVQEALLAVWLEQNYSKEEILELYLNRMFYGHNSYGIEAAAQTYFGKSARNLSLGEAADPGALPQRRAVRARCVRRRGGQPPVLR